VDAEITLIKQAIDHEIPMMGVCLGAQLISKALGAEVSMTKSMETGWHRIVADTSKITGSDALILHEPFEAFEWHEDTFAIPEGAIPVFSGSNLENQGYLYGNILAMQFHLEMTEDMVYEWLQRYQDCMPEPSQSVQSPEQITEHLIDRLDGMHLVADKIYDWWLSMVTLKCINSND
jgi:GMP synthase-like glutamine amidotransferase